MGCALHNSFGEHIDSTFHPGLKREVLVILGHGVTGNKDRPLLVALAKGLSERNWPCLRISYSGNGNSGGRFADSCISKEIADLQSVIGSVPEDVAVVYIGHSMGGAVGVMTTARDLRIRVLVTLSGMVHTADFVKREFGDVVPDQGVMWDDPACPLSQTYVDDLNAIGSTLAAAETIVQPWLLIHGLEDDVIPAQDSRDAFAVAKCVKKHVEIPGADHVFDENSYGRIVEEVAAWLELHFPGI
ncbi:MAG: prolyl oligopeptidase family serine peptidase [Luteolibacter sp.]